MKTLYLDHSATGLLLPEVKQAMIDAMDFYGNPSSLHTPGHLAHNLIEEARQTIATLINARPGEIIFTSGGSESNNMVTNTFAGQKVLVSAIEHPSLLDSARTRCDTDIIPVNDRGEVNTPLHFEDLCSVMLANNELGTLEPVKDLARLAHNNNSFFHTDATQALGKIPINVRDLDIDYMTLSAHKIGGPVGIGALFVKNLDQKDHPPIKPFIIGGHQEHGLRAGTYQTVNIAGFGAAAKYALDNNTPELYQENIKPLRDYLATEIFDKIPHSSLNTPLDNSLPNVLNASFAAAEGESIQLYLDAEDIIVSTGSACASGDGKPSHVLMATKNDAEVAHSSIRFSLGLDTTEDDINSIIPHLLRIVNSLQNISTIRT